MTKAQIRFLVTVFVLLALWRVFEVPAISNAFWEFCTVGAIPGSDRELGPDAMLRLLCIVFAIAFFLIFRKEFMDSLPDRFFRSRRNIVAPTAVETAPVIQEAADRIIVSFTRQTQRPQLAPVRPVLVVIGVAVAWILHSMVVLEQRSQQLGRAIARQSHRMASRLYRLAYPWLQKFGQLCVRLGKVIARYIMKAWRSSEPHIRTIDAWLESQLKGNIYTAEVVRLIDKSSALGKDALQKIQTLIQDFRTSR